MGFGTYVGCVKIMSNECNFLSYEHDYLLIRTIFVKRSKTLPCLRNCEYNFKAKIEAFQ